MTAALALARMSPTLDARWLDLWLFSASSLLAKTTFIGGGAQKRRRTKSLRHHRAMA
jgi:hypothetical protein